MDWSGNPRGANPLIPVSNEPESERVVLAPSETKDPLEFRKVTESANVVAGRHKQNVITDKIKHRRISHPPKIESLLHGPKYESNGRSVGLPTYSRVESVPNTAHSLEIGRPHAIGFD